MNNIDLPEEKYEDLEKTLPTKEQVDNWNKNPNNGWVLKTKKQENNYKLAWLIAFILLVGIFGYMAYGDKFKSENNYAVNLTSSQECNQTCICIQNCTPTFNCNVPSEIKIVNST